MNPNGGGNMADDEDDFTYTEDASGVQKKVPVEKEFIFKVVILGDYSVGKTCLIKRLLAVHSLAPSSPLHDGSDGSEATDSGDDADDALLAAVTPTVGTDFYSLSLPQVLPGASVRLQVWDTAGLEKYAAKYENTFRNASFVICVFDVSSAGSLHNVVDRHLSIAAEHIPDLDQSNIMVVANKIDLIRDMANNTTALRDARKRAQSPETAFEDDDDDDTATNAEFFTSANGIDKDAIVTAKNVQASVFDLFGEVHYTEVSAKTRQNVRAMLQTLVFALLRNSPEVNGTVEVPETASSYDVFARTVLPMQTPGNSPVRKNSPPPPPAAPVTKAPQPPTPPPTSSLLPPVSATSSPNSTPTAPSASWGKTGAFKFDMAPMQLSGTAVFSPLEGPEEHADSQNSSTAVAEIPSSSAPTLIAPRSPASPGASTVKPDDVRVEAAAKGTARKQHAPLRDPNETPQAKKEREQAEMNALLGRGGQRKGEQRGDSAATTTPSQPPSAFAGADPLRDDADRMEDDAAAGRDKRGGNLASAPRVSLLDSLGKQDDKKASGNGGGNDEGRRSDDDEDGVQMHAHLKDRFAQIEHDIRQDNKVARERAKKEKKASGKCKMCVLM